MRKLFLSVTLLLSLLLCTVTAFADSLPPLFPFDTPIGNVFLRPLPEAPPPASSDIPTDETLPPASSDAPTDETLPPASSDAPTDETLPPASSDSIPDTGFISSADVAEILNELKIANATLGILVYGLIPLTFAIVCIFFGIRWFCRTFLSGV